MFINEPDQSTAQVSGRSAFRHLVVFQLKLTADAFRDLLLSPISVLAFALDALRRPALKDSYYLRLMLYGRRTDAMINLFDAHEDAGHYTIDEAVDQLEGHLRERAATRADATESKPE